MYIKHSRFSPTPDKKSPRRYEDVTVYVTMPIVNGLTVTGSGEMIASGTLTTGFLEVNMGGSGYIQAVVENPAGSTVKANISGSGEVVVTGYCNFFSGNIQLPHSLLDFGVGCHYCFCKIQTGYCGRQKSYGSFFYAGCDFTDWQRLADNACGGNKNVS